MLNKFRVDPETRFNMGAASEVLEKPFREVVEAAQLRLKSAKLDESGSKKVFIESVSGKRIYKVTDIHAGNPEGTSLGGLFVEGFQLNTSGKPEERLVSIQLARDPERITKETLYLLRGNDPQDAKRLARELYWSGEISEDRYQEIEAAFGKLDEETLRRTQDNR